MLPSLTKFYIPTQLMVALSWLAFFVPPEVISGRMVLLVILLLMLTNVGKGSLSRVYPPTPKSITLSTQDIELLIHYLMDTHLDARDICGGECTGQLELHGGARVAAGLPDPDHRQHCPGYYWNN